LPRFEGIETFHPGEVSTIPTLFEALPRFEGIETNFFQAAKRTAVAV